MKWNVMHSEYLFKTPFGNLRNDSCQMADGTIINDYYVNEYADWVNAIVLTQENEIVLVEQYRHPGNGLFLEIPAGKMEDGETWEQAIIREVREETGYVSEKPPIQLGEFMVNPATQTNKVITFLIRDAQKKYEQELDDTERILVKRYPFDEMERMISSKQITQLFSVSAYYLAKNHLMASADGKDLFLTKNGS
ncbi:NUDIX hydrolase [Sporosarcina sp. Te-1]|uniref:NUDIX hydrolase n=1 Tax=Sporosarcina sp. Te-1 TaxID=2818390 RepID=UPI001A9D3FD2|nr:NUDIX hydrolase [Sporosarcina sp. Te-1]QTD42572.1 NUDIX hydrolase [Sporosarcina sp. Te-1]